MFKDLLAKTKRKLAHADTRRLAFKDNESAFRYACEYCDCTLVPKREIVALVLDVTGLPNAPPDFYVVKVASVNGGFNVVADPAKPIDVFSIGELVSFWYSGRVDANGAPEGLIADRLLPELDVERGWKKAYENAER